MAYFDDLTRCDYFHDDKLPPLLAVGWLEQGHEYSAGEVPRGLLPRLMNFLRSGKRPWPGTFLGGHVCSLCGDRKSYGHRNLFIPGAGVVYAAPEGIIHYIAAHIYRPPVDFIDATLAAPDAESPEYVAALRACGWPDSYLTSMVDEGQTMSSTDVLGGQANSEVIVEPPNRRLHQTARGWWASQFVRFGRPRG